MEEKLKNLFRQLREEEPGEALKDRILSRIDRERISLARRRLVFSRVGFLVSLSGIILSVYALGASFLNSDFWNILNLTFSDLQTVSKNSEDFIVSLAETFPLMNAVILTIPVFTLFISLSAYFKSKGEMETGHKKYKYA